MYILHLSYTFQDQDYNRNKNIFLVGCTPKWDTNVLWLITRNASFLYMNYIVQNNKCFILSMSQFFQRWDKFIIPSAITIYFGSNKRLFSATTYFTLEGINMFFLVQLYFSLRMKQTLHQQRGWIRSLQGASLSNLPKMR